VFEYRVTKYDPAFRDRAGRYLREEWTSVGDIGRSFGGVVLTREEYRRVEVAHVVSRSRHRVGRYRVEAAAFAQIVHAELDRPAGEVDLFVVDEIGRMELLCPKFVEAVPRLLGDLVPVVATVAMKGDGLIAEVRARPDVRLVEVTGGNRDRLPEEMEAWVRLAKHG
jgi:nucleoside-triphosphatase